MSFIADFYRSLQEPHDRQMKKFYDRLAINSIYSQQLSDELSTTTPRLMFDAQITERRMAKTFNNFYYAHSSLKESPGGIKCSPQAALYYNGKAAENRDAIAAQFGLKRKPAPPKPLAEEDPTEDLANNPYFKQILKESMEE